MEFIPLVYSADSNSGSKMSHGALRRSLYEIFLFPAAGD
jgi:hypothetical protein